MGEAARVAALWHSGVSGEKAYESPSSLGAVLEHHDPRPNARSALGGPGALICAAPFIGSSDACLGQKVVKKRVLLLEVMHESPQVARYRIVLCASIAEHGDPQVAGVKLFFCRYLPSLEYECPQALHRFTLRVCMLHGFHRVFTPGAYGFSPLSFLVSYHVSADQRAI